MVSYQEFSFRPGEKEAIKISEKRKLPIKSFEVGTVYEFKGTPTCPPQAIYYILIKH